MDNHQQISFSLVLRYHMYLEDREMVPMMLLGSNHFNIESGKKKLLYNSNLQGKFNTSQNQFCVHMNLVDMVKELMSP